MQFTKFLFITLISASFACTIKAHGEKNEKEAIIKEIKQETTAEKCLRYTKGTGSAIISLGSLALGTLILSDCPKKSFKKIKRKNYLSGQHALTILGATMIYTGYKTGKNSLKYFNLLDKLQALYTKISSPGLEQ